MAGDAMFGVRCRAIEAAADVFARLSTTVAEEPIPDFHQVQTHFKNIIFANVAAFHQKRLQTQPELFGELFLNRVKPGLYLGAVDFVRSLRWLEKWSDNVGDFAENEQNFSSPRHQESSRHRSIIRAESSRSVWPIRAFAWPWADRQTGGGEHCVRIQP